MPSERKKQEINVQRQACPYCKAQVEPDQPKLACDGCMAWHHAECWTAHTACSACGFETPSGSRAVETQPKVVRPCSVAGCLDPATVVDGAKDWCRAHLDEARARGFRSLLFQIRQFSGFSYVSMVLAVIALASAVFLPTREYANLFMAIPLAFGSAFHLFMRRHMRLRLEKQLAGLKDTQKRDALPVKNPEK